MWDLSNIPVTVFIVIGICLEMIAVGVFLVSTSLFDLIENLTGTGRVLLIVSVVVSGAVAIPVLLPYWILRWMWEGGDG